MKNRSLLFYGLLMAMLMACSGGYVPKPHGYFRIELPEKSYRVFDSACPYSFEYPVYARVVPDTEKGAEACWLNLDFPKLNGRLHLSYKPVHGNLKQYLEDARTLVIKHIPKASGIDESLILEKNRKVFGMTWEIKGTGAASPFQFFVTDSTRHFVRGALYFDLVPNNDSLAPVIDFIREDIRHMVSTFRWK